MRFKKGTRIEVMSKGNMPSVAWRCAEIISGNGHTYTVRYDSSLGSADEAELERVPRKAIRPCPPPVENMDGWAAGDITEVSICDSWKTAVILEALGEDFYLVRLLGSLEELRVHKSNTRARQSWLDGCWVLIGKVSGKRKRSSLKSHTNSSKVQCVDTRKEFKDGADLASQGTDEWEAYNFDSHRTLERGPPDSFSYVGTPIRKRRSTDREGEHWEVVSSTPSTLVRKVDDVPCSSEYQGEKYLNASFNKRSGRYFGMDGRDPNGNDAYLPKRGTVFLDYDSDACSIGSCSGVSDSPASKTSYHVLVGPSKDSDTTYSGEESSYVREDEDEKITATPKEDEKASLHKLELHAYRSTLEAMFASGPISWDQEALLTNLRISLHISNDEHLGQSWRLACLASKALKFTMEMPLGINNWAVSASIST